MPRIPPVDPSQASAEQRAAHGDTVRALGRMTNMKSTLLHSMPAFNALMEWYPLRDTVQPFLGERLTTIFSHAISAETDCLICSTYFRRILADSGDDPDNFVLDEREQTVVDFALCLSRPNFTVPDELYAHLKSFFDDEQIVVLTAFGALMLATNVVNNALEVDLDEYLEPYAKDAARTESAS